MDYSTNIRKKDKGWQYIITYKDCTNKWKTKSKQGFKTRQDARNAMDNMVLELKNIVVSGITPNGVTFKQFADIYIEHLKLHREANTILELERVIKTFDSLKDIELSKITRLDIQKEVDRLVKNGLKSRTINLYVSRLKSFFLSAINDYNLISKHPVSNIKIKKDKLDNESKRALNNNEAQILLDYLKNYKNNTDYFFICSIAIKSGLRLGEILGLTWADIDFKNEEINIDKQWKLLEGNNVYGFGVPKSNNSVRKVPISKSLLNELRDFQELSNINKENVIDFANKKNISLDKRLFNYRNSDSVGICINRLFKRQNFNITVHELRHTFATNLIANGVDFKTAASLLGHDVKETMRTYSHVNDTMKQRATELIKNIF